MVTYRVYALIHGHILHEGSLSGCLIAKMSIKDQEARGFAPMEAKFREDEMTKQHKTYVTNLTFIDPVRIKSEYVIICDLNESDASSALGGAIRLMDKACRLLSLTRLEDSQRHYSRERLPFEPYIYQVNQIYILDKDGNETSTDHLFDPGHTYLPDRPERNEWFEKSSNKLLQALSEMHDEPLERALKYLYRSAIGNLILDSPEKVVVDHAKTIEILLKAIQKKGTFRQKLTVAKEKFGLTDEEVNSIKELWKVRSEYGDVAHPSLFDQAERYPNQFPLPSNTATHPVPSLSFAANFCLKYFHRRKRLFLIDIETPDEVHEELRLAVVNPHTETNHLLFYAKGNKQQLATKLKGAICEYLDTDDASIEEFSWKPGCRQAELLIKECKL